MTSPDAALPVTRPSFALLRLDALPRPTMALIRRFATLDRGVLLLVLVAAVGVRAELEPWPSGDYTNCLNVWFTYLQAHGFRGLGDQFADYNMPYLYLLYIGTLLPFHSLLWVKMLGLLADIALALGCASLARTMGVSKQLLPVVAIAVTLLPEVVLNSAAWGQADSLYGALLVWGLAAAVRGRGTTAWVMFALAFTFKLQAVFVLPAFVIAHMLHRWRWRSIGIGVLAGLATDIPALIAGRSPISLALVYFAQAGEQTDLTRNAPNMYWLLPAWAADMVRPAGTLFAVAVVGTITYLALIGLRRGCVRPQSIAVLAAGLALVAPYLLPMMHERYFYVGNVLLFVLALKQHRLLPAALAAQAIAVIAYAPFLFNATPTIPMPLLALAEAAIVGVAIWTALREFHGAAPASTKLPIDLGAVRADA